MVYASGNYVDSVIDPPACPPNGWRGATLWGTDNGGPRYVFLFSPHSRLLPLFFFYVLLLMLLLGDDEHSTVSDASLTLAHAGEANEFNGVVCLGRWCS